MGRMRILPDHFRGTWTVVASWKDKPEQATIFKEQGHYYFKWKNVGEKRRTTYNPETDTLEVPDERLCISFWRHPSMDHIFARSHGKESPPLWGARRLWEGQDDGDHHEICRGICGRWHVDLTTGTGTPKQDSWVVIKKTSVSDEIPGNWDDVAPRMFYLFEECKCGKMECYDLLMFDSRTVSFNSIFRVRSINLWSPKHEKKTIFAMFDNRFTLPIGHFGHSHSRGHSRLGGLMAFESDQCEKAMKAAADPSSDPEDPNTGCWTGSGG